eukprot:m.24964 g.24964  ORF g.24964 m.24964 type:complete len:213 (-) comp14818_c0_seq1:331-969(-)
MSGADGPEKSDVTVLDDSVKHPLQNSWVLWFDPGSFGHKNKVAKTWIETLEQIYTIKTVEDFWAVFNNIVPPQSIPAGSNYYIFKEGVQPQWEDSRNKLGGKWQVITNRQQRERLNTMWENTLLLLVGEQFAGKDNDQICGAVVQNRAKGDKLSIWTQDHKDQQACERIGQLFKKELDTPPSVAVGYAAHNPESAGLGRSASYNTPSMYTLK